MNNFKKQTPHVAASSDHVIDRIIAKREQFLQDNNDHRKIVNGPDLKEMLDSLSIGNNIQKPCTNPMVCMRLAKPFNGIRAVHLAIIKMERSDQAGTTRWEFTGIMTYDDSDLIGQHRGVEGTYSTTSRTGILRFFERKDSK